MAEFVVRNGLISKRDVSVTGSVTAQSFTGSIQGTASLSQTAISSSHAYFAEFSPGSIPVYTGQASIPFNGWKSEDSASITGQTNISSSSQIFCSIYADVDDVYVEDWDSPVIKDVVNGVGFTIYLKPKHGVHSGSVKINWQWRPQI